MTFAIGFVCGLVLGLTLAWLSVVFFHPIDLEETGTLLFAKELTHVQKSIYPEKELKK
jgi:hypothetical protein